MFEQIPASTPDAILGLNEVFLADPRPERVNLTVGVYVDQSGHTPILRSVKQAEQRLLETEQTKTYLNIAGDAEYGRLVRELLLGESHPLIRDRRVVSLQTPGGTGALRVTADFVAKHYPQANVWVSDPTWANHAAIFAAAGVPSKMYPYYDHRSHEVALQAMLDGLSQAPAGDFVILHGCCHNPTGADPNAEGWQQIAELCQTRSLLPIVDLAYQGFGHGMEEDVQGLKTLTEHLPEIIVCSSFSKSFGLYRERTGALCAIAGNAATAQTLLDAIKICVRRNYSNPPSHGAAIVATILGEPGLRAEWQRELSEMRANIQQKRLELANALTAASWREDVNFLRSQIGMFSLIGLPPEAIDKLREDYAVYLVRNGRLNMAGIQHSNLDYVVNSLLKVAE